jgi:D-alanyl-D-alanine-carboxypeptidase/D-alanyl-D-alanine-endopeptidase
MNLRPHRLACVLALTLLVPAPPVAQSAASAQHFPATADLQEMLRYLVEDNATPGIVLGILEADGSTRIVSHGSAGAGAQPLSAKTTFEIGSITKTFTGTLLADMVAKGEVALADPISKYLPKGVAAPSRSGREITLLDLATHRSGLPRLPENLAPADRTNPYADYTVQMLYAFLSKHQLRRDPGAEPEYSNVGVGLLGHVLALAAKTSYRELVKTRILTPLGMTMTGFEREGAIAQSMAKGHTKGEIVPYWSAIEPIEAAGALKSNVEDMLKYLRAQVGPPRNALERAMRDAHGERAPVSGSLTIGLAWQRATSPHGPVVTHGGGTAGFSTYVGFNPEKRVGFVMLTNTGGLTDNIGLDFLRRGPPLDHPEVTLARGALERFAGTYEAEPGRQLIVRMEPTGRLSIQLTGSVRSAVYARSDTTFFTKRAPWQFRFTTDAAGAVTGLNGEIEGKTQTYRKIG